MIVIDSSDVPELSRWHSHWVYNVRDCCITHEVYTALKLDEISQRVYDFEMSMYPMAFEIMQRGVLVDQLHRAQLNHVYTQRLLKLESWLNRLSDAVIGKPVNHKSPAQLMDLFYEQLKLPVQYNVDKITREKKPTTDREALEKLCDYLIARPFCLTLLKLRDIEKTLQVLRAPLYEDGRMRFSFNPAGTETQRWSSSKNPDKTGMNFQNITHELRRMFIADPGYKLGYADLAQAESRAVAYLSRDDAYTRACESGDLHTAVAELIWPHLKSVHDPYYRHFSFRDIAKRAGHASNYKGKPYTISKAIHVEQKLIEQFQSAYFSTFPGISRWHHETEQELSLTGELISPTGFRRQFLKRLRDEQTLKEAIAFKPQNIVGWTGAKGMKDIFDLLEPSVKVLGNMHDAVVFQYPVDRPELARMATEIFGSVDLYYPGVGRKALPSELKVGYNWADLAPLGQDSDQARPDYDKGLLQLVI